MAAEVTLEIVAQAELGNKSLVVTVEQNGNILGHLMVGKASLVWLEKNKKT